MAQNFSILNSNDYEIVFNDINKCLLKIAISWKVLVLQQVILHVFVGFEHLLSECYIFITLFLFHQVSDEML